MRQPVTRTYYQLSLDVYNANGGYTTAEQSIMAYGNVDLVAISPDALPGTSSAETNIFLSVSPNPSTGETTVSLLASDNETVQSTTAWDMEIYTQNQLLKERKPRQIGRSATINTSGWPEGLYIVKVVYNGDILIGKLMVKH